MTPPRARSGLTVAAAQRASVPGDVAANARSAAEGVREAAARGARLVVLPELYLCGYDLATLRTDPDGCDLGVDRLEAEARGRLAPLVDACAGTGTLALVGASVRHGPGPADHRVAGRRRVRATSAAGAPCWTRRGGCRRPCPTGGSLPVVATLDRQTLEATRAAHRMHAERRESIGAVRFATPA